MSEADKTDVEKTEDAVKKLVQQSAEATQAEDALKFSQAALNIANASCAMAHVASTRNMNSNGPN